LQSCGAQRDKQQPIGLQAVINKALKWERRSGATFEEDKTVIIHFTRHPERTDESPYTIKGQTIISKKSGKILGRAAVRSD
jgi:hypothetical protein